MCTDSKPQGMMAAIYFCSFIILSSMMILNLFIGVITSSMQDAKTELSADLEEDEEKDEDEIMMKRLQELYDIMNEASEEITELASLEKERSQSAVVQLSRSKLLNNKDCRTLHLLGYPVPGSTQALPEYMGSYPGSEAHYPDSIFIQIIALLHYLPCLRAYHAQRAQLHSS